MAAADIQRIRSLQHAMPAARNVSNTVNSAIKSPNGRIRFSASQISIRYKGLVNRLLSDRKIEYQDFIFYYSEIHCSET